MTKRSSLIVSLGFTLITLALSWFAYPCYVVSDADPDFSPIGYDYQYRGKLFSGVLYRRHGNHALAMLAFLWQGKKIGTERLWHDTGAVFAVQPYKNGQPHGDWKQWYPDGSVKSLRHYEDGLIDGESWSWHPNGQLSDFNLNNKGKEISHKSWVSDGTPFYNYVTRDGERIGMRGGEFCKRLTAIFK